MRPLADAFWDVLCGLIAYALSRWLWEGQGGIWANLPKELATFLGTFLLLRLVLAMWGRSRRQRLEAERVARTLRNTPSPPPR
jgi:hypothetical protein